MGLILLALVIAAFVPKHLAYERSIDINANKEVVFGIANDLKTQETWGPWSKEDPSIQNTYNEVAAGVGQVSSWTSKKSGNGSQTIIESTPPTAIKYRIDFEGEGGGDSAMKFDDSEGGGTKATWAFSYDVPYPFNLMAAMMMSGSMNKMLEDGLAGLKEMAEQKAAEAPTTGGFVVKQMDFPGRTYLGVREQTTHEEVAKSTFFADRFGRILTLLNQSKMQPAGSPAGIYYTWDMEKKTTDMVAAIPLNSGTAVAGGAFKTFEVPASKALVVDYYGNYNNFAAAHEAIGAYINANGLVEKPPVIEEYITDPMSEKDTAKWLTKIIYMVEGK